MLFDTHCHIHFRSYANDREAVIARANTGDILMITVGTNIQTSRDAIEIAERFDFIFASVGLHPHHVIASAYEDPDEGVGSGVETFDPHLYRELATHPKCVAIGECGLDYYRLSEVADREAVIELQKKIVRAHFDLADELNLPVIVHCRDAYEDQLKIVSEYVASGKLKQRGVVHCFGGSLESAQAFVKLGFKIGMTGIVTFPPRKNELLVDGLTCSQLIMRELPLTSILIETDAPYLAPMPHRGKRNEPAYVKFVAEKIAEIRGVSVDVVANTTTANAKMLFHV